MNNTTVHFSSDAAAIAWAIAKNKAEESKFEAVKKSYRDGLKDGDNGKGEVIELWETTAAEITITDPAPGTADKDPSGTAPNGAEINISSGGGVWAHYVNPDDPEDFRKIHFYVDDYISAGGNWYWKGRPKADIYNNQGNIIATVYMTTNAGSYIYRVERANRGYQYITQYKIYANAGVIPRIQGVTDGGQTIDRWGEWGYSSLRWDNYVRRYVYVDAGNDSPGY